MCIHVMRNLCFMLSLAYVSKASRSLLESEVTVMKSEFARANHEHNITGFLVYSKGRFFQYIEGPKFSIDSLMHNIRLDHLHKVGIEIIKDIGTRKFENWEMKWFDIQDLSDVVTEDYLIDLMTFSASRKELLPNWENMSWDMIEKISQRQKILLPD